LGVVYRSELVQVLVAACESARVSKSGWAYGWALMSTFWRA
jgi:hypothetical protein